MTVEQLRGSDDPYAGTGLPALGLRNYWYPVMAAWRLGRRPLHFVERSAELVHFEAAHFRRLPQELERRRT